MKIPNSRRNLDIAIERKFGRGNSYMRARTAMANVVVGQLLPGGAVKGGSAIKLRFGEEVTRFTTDLDVARATGLDEYVADLEDALDEGWCGFSGTVVPRRPAHPKDVPDQYVMGPYDIKLSYNGTPWCTVPLEVGHDEIGDADEPDWGLPDDVRQIFLDLGFPEPRRVPLMPLHHQVAQKLHAVTAPGGERAHDLIDLQVIVSMGELDFPLTRATCERLFAYRGMQQWPPEVAQGPGWEKRYDDQRAGVDVLPTVTEAVEWANDLVRRIARA